MERLRCGVLGLAGEGQTLLEAVAANRALELVALADPDHPALRETAETFHAPVFRDCRSSLVEASPQAAFVALPAFQAVDALRTAAERGIAVFQLAPWAIDFEAAVGVVQLFERSGHPHVIARPWRVEPAYEPLREISPLLGRVYALEVNVTGTRVGRQGWRGDAQRAGGGTLFHDAYEPVDMLVTLCGLPEQVYAITAWVPGPGEPRPYDTEDAMSVLCRYTQDRMVTITSCRTADVGDWKVVLRGSRASAEITPPRLRILDGTGQKVTEKRVRQRNRYSLAVAAFTTALLEGVHDTSSTARQHLPTMALLQAAYLSAKTGHPESPAKLLDLAGRA